ncbi:hypothetical protein [Acidiferrobacter sp.]|uniref:hypothetical protein n=1 Tax=Acidiferrobacter sp. TaxID=1872107 RepID=UPI002603AEDD|nr:hypothetical protein [Acidiferrobacter sp.]
MTNTGGTRGRVRTATYCGPDRRRWVRRTHPERRALVRWEPDLGGRRQNEGRRATDSRFACR